jgi:hypothetical protein
LGRVPPRFVSGVVVGLYQLSSLILHASDLSPTLSPADTHGLIMHMVMDFLIVILLFIGLIRIRSSAGNASVNSTLIPGAQTEEYSLPGFEESNGTPL